MARNEIPSATFEVADVMSYDFPAGLNVVFSFASLLHNPKEDMQIVLARIAEALHPGGVVFLSLKRRDRYETDVVDDGYTKRRYYYYTQETILSVMPSTLQAVHYLQQSRQEEWFTMILQKPA
jgi:trans-aconitate methyltransferase